MGRQQDILFCKIAISTGLVNQDQAEKCLILCDRREREGKRRPMVGAVFSKYKLMRAEEVQRIYAAVNKRLGSTAMSPTAGGRLATRRRGRAGNSTRGNGAATRIRSLGRPRAPKKSVDKNTLWMGIGFGVVFVGVLFVIMFLFSKAGTSPAAKAPDLGSGTSVSSATREATRRETAPRASPTPPPPQEIKAEQLELDPEFVKQHKIALQRARLLAVSDIRPDRALTHLKEFYKENKAEYRISGPQLTAIIQAEIEGLQRQVADVGQEAEEETGNGEGGEESAEDEDFLEEEL